MPGERSEEVLLVERAGAVLTITFNRPRLRNAINREVAERVGAALDLLDRDPELRAAVLSGAGGCFSSGMDLGALLEGESAWVGERGFAGIVKRGARKPLLAAVEGFAVAGGFEIALACDMIVAAEDSYFALPEVKRCLIPVGGGIYRLRDKLPENVAREIALLGERVPAGRLAEHGLVNRLTPPGEALAVALGLAATVAANAPLAVAGTKEIFDRLGDATRPDLWPMQEAIAAPVEASEDMKEGSRAFLEKRDPVWKGF